MLAEFFERGRACRDCQRIAGECAGLKDLARWEHVVQHVAAATVRAQRQSAADDLAECGEVGRDAQDLLRAAERQPEAGHHLVEDQKRAVLVCQPPRGVEKLLRRHDQPHVADHRFHDDGGDGVATRAKRGLELLRIVVFEHDRVLRRAGRHAGGIRHAERGGRRPCGHQQTVGMAVVVAGELDQLVAAGESPRQSHGAHRRLGAGAHHPHLLDARYGVDDQLGQPALRFGGRAVAGARLERCLDRGNHSRVPMAEDHRPPRADVVEVGVAVDVGELLPACARKEDRLTAHASKGPCR